MPPVKKSVYSDHEVVAAFNSCLDLAKFKALPQSIKNRFCLLLRAHRVKPVCFMNECGLGLRVFGEATTEMLNFGEGSGGDEVSIKPEHATKVFKVDDEGSWMRCPPSLYVSPVPPPTWLVMDEYGVQFLEDISVADSNDDSDEETYNVDWTTNRTRATTYREKNVADLDAVRANGVVVKNKS